MVLMTDQRQQRQATSHGLPCVKTVMAIFIFLMPMISNEVEEKKKSVGVNVGVFFRHEKAQPFQIGPSH
jgi:hypothetical protein